MNLLLSLFVLQNFLLLISGAYSKQYNLTEIINLAVDVLELSLNKSLPINPDTDLTIEEFLTKYKYPLESHQVTTEDGYILTLHRIPHGKNENSSTLLGKSKPVALLKSGLFCSAMDFILVGPGKSLAMILADTGYDVWLLNTRGNRYSMNHKTFKSTYDSAQFWNFSYHEKGYYDAPAAIDYIINTTSVNKITFIGHSQGTTEGLILGATRPEYNDKLNLMVLLSPIAYMGNITSAPALILQSMRKELIAFAKIFNIHGFPHTKLLPLIGKIMCNEASPLLNFCVDLIQIGVGLDYKQFNKSLMTIIPANTPSGASFKELLHYSQAISSGKFAEFDYQKDNQLYYNSSTPPRYNMSKVSVPVAAYYGQNDFLATLPNVEKILSELPNLQVSSLLEYKLFNHVDFIYAIEVKKLLYDSVIETMQKYNPI